MVLNLLYQCRIWREDTGEEIEVASHVLAKLKDIPVEISLQLGEQVKLSRQMEYTVCNVVLFPKSLFPPTMESMKERLHDRVYNFPSYVFIGESQCGIIEVHRGDLSTGYVRFITKWVDVLEVDVLKANNRCLLLTVHVWR